MVAAALRHNSNKAVADLLFKAKQAEVGHLRNKVEVVRLLRAAEALPCSSKAAVPLRACEAAPLLAAVELKAEGCRRSSARLSSSLQPSSRTPSTTR